MKNHDDKNIYDILNDIEIDLSEYEREDFNDIEKIKIKKKFRQAIGKKNLNNNHKKYISAALIALVSLITISFTPVGTYASKVISDLVFDIKAVLGVATEQEGYIKTINKSITKDDITLRLNEAILNDDELIVSLTTISEEDIDKDETVWTKTASKLYINGEEVDYSQSGTLDKVSKRNIDEVMFFRLNTSKYKGTISVKLELSGIDKGFTEEPFIFEFELDTNKINKDIKNITINKVIDFGNDKKITLDKFIYTPLTQKICFTQNKKAFDNEVDMVLKGRDDLDNEIEFDTYHGEDEAGQLIADINKNKIDKSAKYLILTVYERTFIQDGKNLVPKLNEIENNIKIDLTN